jgi:hypothetical protein
LPEYPSKKDVDEELPGFLRIFCRDVNRNEVETEAAFVFKKYGDKPVPHIHLVVEDYILYDGCPDCGSLTSYGTEDTLQSIEPIPAPETVPPAPGAR